jgi:hypothetical protein
VNDYHDENGWNGLSGYEDGDEDEVLGEDLSGFHGCGFCDEGKRRIHHRVLKQEQVSLGCDFHGVNDFHDESGWNDYEDEDGDEDEGEEGEDVSDFHGCDFQNGCNDGGGNGPCSKSEQQRKIHRLVEASFCTGFPR